MKKLLLVGIATTAMLASCSNDETMGTPEQNAAIGFSSFVDKSTRSIVEGADMQDEWAVWGFWNQTNQLFATVPQRVEASGTYTPTRYWTLEKTYHFVGLSPYNSVNNNANVYIDNGVISVFLDFTNEDGEADLLYAKDDTYGNSELKEITGNPVNMTFEHMLSKVKFSFENNIGEGYSFTVSDIELSQVKKTATLKINNDTKEWENIENNGSLVLNFTTANGGEQIENNVTMPSDKEYLIIPTEKEVRYYVSFSLDLFLNEDKLVNYKHTQIPVSTNFEMGKSYNFKATITSKNVNPELGDDVDTEIRFTPEVNPWETPDVEEEIENYEKSDDSTEE